MNREKVLQVFQLYVMHITIRIRHEQYILNLIAK